METGITKPDTIDYVQLIEQDKLEQLLEGEKRIRKQNFLKIIHQDPYDVQPIFERMKKHPQYDTVYIPISVVEMLLDQLYFGEWSTQNFSTKQVLNEVVGELELVVIHPVTGREITRAGAAAVPIQQKKDALPQELEKKYTRALEKDYPHVKAECVKNAAKSLGRIFGRDLGRTDTAGDYAPFINEAKEEKVHQSLASVIDKARNGKDEEDPADSE